VVGQSLRRLAFAGSTAEERYHIGAPVANGVRTSSARPAGRLQRRKSLQARDDFVAIT